MLTIFCKAIWDQRRTLPAWASGVFAVIVLEAAMWPSMKSMPSLDTYLAEFPDALKEVFSIEEMSTGTGFLNAELFSLVLPLLFVVFGILRGARMVAGEEEAGTLDLLLVTRLSTTTLLVAEALALFASTAALGAAAVAGTLVGSAAFGLGVAPQAMLAGAAACVLLGLVHGTAALVLGAVLGRRGPAIGAATTVALAGYVLYIGGLFVDRLADARQLSPFHQALHSGPLSGELPASFLVPALASVLAVGIVLPLWARRDIGARR